MPITTTGRFALSHRPVPLRVPRAPGRGGRRWHWPRPGGGIFGGASAAVGQQALPSDRVPIPSCNGSVPLPTLPPAPSSGPAPGRGARTGCAGVHDVKSAIRDSRNLRRLVALDPFVDRSQGRLLYFHRPLHASGRV